MDGVECVYVFGDGILEVALACFYDHVNSLAVRCFSDDSAEWHSSRAVEYSSGVPEMISMMPRLSLHHINIFKFGIFLEMLQREQGHLEHNFHKSDIRRQSLADYVSLFP